MKINGNTLVNKKYNPRNVRPKIPIDADEVDSVMERFIRQKYQEMSLSDGRPRPPSRHEREPAYEREAPPDREFNRSPETSPPPPLPPKKGKLFSFGLRSTSASYPYLSKADKKRMTRERDLTIEPTTENAFHSSVTSPLPSKQSRIFGANIGNDANIETKLSTLKDMGFPDGQRNSTMLKSLNGDLERTIESLVRLGEGSQPGSRSRTPNRTPRGSMRGTPTTSAFPDDLKSPTLKPPSGTNPFDRPSGGNIGLSLAPPPAEQKAGGSFNPFGIPPDPQVLEQSLSNLQISQQPPLFPHSTGGYPSQPPPMQFDRLQQSMTPPVPSTYNPFFQSMPSLQSSLNPYNQMMPSPQSATQPNNPFFGQGYGASNAAQSPQPIEQYGQPSQSSYNPFQAQFSNQQAQQNVQSQSFSQPQSQPQQQSTNPFGTNFGGQMAGGMPDLFSGGQTSQQANVQQQQQQQQLYPSFPQQQFQQAPQQQQQPQPQASQLQSTTNGYPQPQNPYQVQQPQQNPYQQPQIQQPSQFQSAPNPLMPQQTGRYDKSSILALYNYPHLAPPLPTIQDEPSPSGEMPSSYSQQATTTAAVTPQRSVTMPLLQQQSSISQSRNPFLGNNPTTINPSNPNMNNTTTMSSSSTSASNGGGGGSGPPPTAGNWSIANRSRSRESADLAAWQQQQNQNGRHSPDAIFGGLSARYGR